MTSAGSKQSGQGSHNPEPVVNEDATCTVHDSVAASSSVVAHQVLRAASPEASSMCAGRSMNNSAAKAWYSACDTGLPAQTSCHGRPHPDDEEQKGC